jgi:hypothetical protein
LICRIKKEVDGVIVEYTIVNTDNPLQSFDYLDYDKAKLKVDALRLQGKSVRVIGIDENGNEKEIDM